MNRITQWSYSRLKTYEQCPSKVKFRYIDKLSEPSSPQMDRGTRIHKLAEDFVTEKIDIIPDELMLFQTQFTMLKDAKAKCEAEWGFTTSWTPTGFFADDAWLRVKTDAIYSLAPGTVTIIDHKTGRIYADDHKDQLHLYALAGFIMFSAVHTIKAQDWYLDQDAVIELEFDRAQMPMMKEQWNDRVQPMLRDDIFPARPGPHCNWCFYRRAVGGPCSF